MEACDEGWEANGDHCYLFGVEKKNWTAAEDFCRKEAGHLATVKNNATKEFVLERLASKNLGSSLVRAWIGGNDIREEGVWRWRNAPLGRTCSGRLESQPTGPPMKTALSLVSNTLCNRIIASGRISTVMHAESLSLCSKRICSSDNLEGKTKCIIWNFSSLGVQ